MPIPKFEADKFRFANEPPQHVEAFPSFPSYAGIFCVFGAVIDGQRTYPLATDIPDEETARLIAEARAIYQEETINRYGYSDDVVIIKPDCTEERTYFGRIVED